MKTVDDQYLSGKFWEKIPDFLAGQAPAKVSHLLGIIDSNLLYERAGKKKISIVDIGCGAGKVSTGLAKELCLAYPGLKAEVAGFDISPQAIDEAKRLNTEGTFVCGDFRDSGAVWDLALLCDVIEHVPDPDDTIKAVAEKSRFYAIGFCMDDNLANRLDKKRRQAAMASHVTLYNEKTARALAGRYGKVLATKYTEKQLKEILVAKRVRHLFTLPARLLAFALGHRVSGMLFGGESIYFFVESNLYKENRNR